MGAAERDWKGGAPEPFEQGALLPKLRPGGTSGALLDRCAHADALSSQDRCEIAG